jgi:hypothetical protein
MAAGRREDRAVEQVSSRENRASFSSWLRLIAGSMRSGIQDRVIELDIPRFAPRPPAISLNFTRPAAKKRPSNRPVIRSFIRTYQLAATLSNRSKLPAGFAEIPAFPSGQSRTAPPQNARQDRIVRRGTSEQSRKSGLVVLVEEAGCVLHVIRNSTSRYRAGHPARFAMRRMSSRPASSNREARR